MYVRTDGWTKYPLHFTEHRPFGAAAQKGNNKLDEQFSQALSDKQQPWHPPIHTWIFSRFPSQGITGVRCLGYAVSKKGLSLSEMKGETSRPQAIYGHRHPIRIHYFWMWWKIELIIEI